MGNNQQEWVVGGFKCLLFSTIPGDDYLIDVLLFLDGLDETKKSQVRAGTHG